MQAAKLIGIRRFKLIKTADPRPHENQALVKISHIAICGTDLHLCSIERTKADYAALPTGFSGHECVGRVIECPDGSLIREQPVLVIGDNTFQELFTIEPNHLLPLPDNIPLEQGVLAQLLGTVIYACKRFGSVVGQDVAVLGQGPAGLLFTRVLRQLGARQIITTDIIHERILASENMGATYTINALQENVPEIVRELTHGKMADLVIEASGDTNARNQALECTRWRGTVHLFGLPEKDMLPCNFGKFFENQVLMMCTGKTAGEPGLHSFKLAIQWISRGIIDVSGLISHQLYLSEINKGFDLAYAREDGALKILLLAS